MDLISGRQVVCLGNDRNETVSWQENINPAKEQFLSCPKAKIRFFFLLLTQEILDMYFEG